MDSLSINGPLPMLSTQPVIYDHLSYRRDNLIKHGLLDHKRCNRQKDRQTD